MLLAVPLFGCGWLLLGEANSTGAMYGTELIDTEAAIGRLTVAEITNGGVRQYT